MQAKNREISPLGREEGYVLINLVVVMFIYTLHVMTQKGGMWNRNSIQVLYQIVPIRV